jgi:MFS family permease
VDVVDNAAGGDAGAVTAGSWSARRQWRIYAVALLAEVSLLDAIWIIYLRDRGLSLAQIGAAEAAFHLAPLTLELPTGSLADVLGRKWSLALGALAIVLSTMLLWTTTGFWMALPAMYLWGASYTFRSGAEQAFLFDALAEQGETSRFARLFGRLRSASYLLVAVGAWAGGVLAGIDYAWPFAITIAIGLARVWLAAGLREPVRERPAHRRIGRNIVEALQIVRERQGLAPLLAFTALFWTLSTLIGLYVQAVLSESGVGTSDVGLVVAVSLVVTAGGGWIAHRLAGEHRFVRWTVVFTAAMVGCGIGLGSGHLVVAIAAVLVAGFAGGLFEPVLAARINEGLPAAQRATILSVESFLISATMIWAFPLAGWAAERWSWGTMYAGAGAVVVVALVIWITVGRRTGRVRTEG